MQRTTCLLLAVGSLVALAGCGENGEPGGIGSFPFDRKRANTLSDGEKQQVCDWAAGQWGGYGTIVQCGNWTISGPASLGDLRLCLYGIAQDRCAIITHGLPPECEEIPKHCLE